MEVVCKRVPLVPFLSLPSDEVIRLNFNRELRERRAARKAEEERLAELKAEEDRRAAMKAEEEERRAALLAKADKEGDVLSQTFTERINSNNNDEEEGGADDDEPSILNTHPNHTPKFYPNSQ